MLRFYFALWASKFISFIFTLRGDAQNDWPGLLAMKLCPDFLSRVGKPKLIITITGTNGKTTTSALVNNFLREQGYSTSFNDWGANITAGFSVNLLRAVNIFNRPKVDASILEADENTLGKTMPLIKPNYILITNICKDSLRRNGHPEFIFDRVNKAFQALGDKTTAILNANDPISSQLAMDTGTPRVYYGMTDAGATPCENLAKDIQVCPYCGGKIKYNYRFYRHIGDFYCEDCDFHTPTANYYGSEVDLDGRVITIENHNYSLISPTVFNAFNVLSTVALFRTLGFEEKKISEFMSGQQVTKLRESTVEYDGIKYHTFSAKSQNVSAASIVFDYMAQEPTNKNVVLCMDEVQDKNHPTETLTWLYETDYEPLNSPNIKKIICAGHMYLNHKLRLLLAGVPEERIACVEDESLVPSLVDTEGIESVYVLFETDIVSKAISWRDAIVEKAKEVKSK